MVTSVDDQGILERVHRHRLLVGLNPRRSQVLAQATEGSIHVHGSVSVWRNHAFEPIQQLVDVFLRHAGLDLVFILGEYDDGLMLPPRHGSDAQLVWFDLDRVSLSASELPNWFARRIEYVVRHSNVPVIVVPISEHPALLAAITERLGSIAGVFCVDTWSLCRSEQLALIDERTASLAGTRLSRDAQMHVARALGLRWLPAALRPPLKLVAVDLDGTLHRGVLGEDGIGGVEVSSGHRRLHEYLKKLSSEGFMLALVSRNELEDVQNLFSSRRLDYGLSLEDFVAVEVSWDPKPDALRRVAQRVRIGLESIVFVDDNPGELLSVGMELPAIELVHASDAADETVQALLWTSGLWRISRDSAAALRVADLKANAAREQLMEQVFNRDDYFAELGVRIEVSVDRFEHLSRLADLSAKTNQFNLSLQRLGEAELRKVMEGHYGHVVSIVLADRLSNSGVIALVVASRDGSVLYVREVAVSCRALGRGLESIVLAVALKAIPGWRHVRDVCFEVRETERNLPARKWLAEVSGQASSGVSPRQVFLAASLWSSVTIPESVSISIVP